MELSKSRFLQTVSGVTFAGLALLGQSTAHAEDALADGKLTVGMEIAYPPFESYDGDKVVGFDPELATLLSNKLNVEAEFIDAKFTNLILGIKSQKFDAVISGMYVTPERILVTEAIPYARTGAFILTLKDAEIKPIDENGLCGLKVGLQQGTSWVKDLTALSDGYCAENNKGSITIQEFPTAPEVSQALISHNVDAQVEIAGAARMFVERSRGRIEISSPELIYPQTMGLFLKKGDMALKNKVEDAMAQIKADGSYQMLIDKYELTAVSE
ncbi:transporter substrate-binding domain-containing protein [Psychromonas sp. PT13]|uniref:transporter substrate-binding domain-containing protein n=1 Tax=Psychromonas sp. PT13 TaxID=3439547 RepID=UPI003EBD0639